MPDIYLVQGTASGYEATSWIVEAWTSKVAAERRSAELNAMCGHFSAQATAHSFTCPQLDDTDASHEAFERWRAKEDRMLRAARRAAGDPMLERDASYAVIKTRLCS